MRVSKLFWLCAVSIFICSSIPVAHAQGTRADYNRAVRFLPWNVEPLVFTANVKPHWINGSNRFWYRRVKFGQKDFILVDPARATQGPAFDQARLASSLSKALGTTVDAEKLPFDEFQYIHGRQGIRFAIDGNSWTCTLSSYQCKEGAEVAERERGLSPNGRWFAFVRNHNLWIRSTTTEETIQLTKDGVAGDDYATRLPGLKLMVKQETENVHQPASVFWSPDSSKILTYRIDSRYAGRFTSLQFVPPSWVGMRPLAFTYVYPLPGEVLPMAYPIVFDVIKHTRVNVQVTPLQLTYVGGPRFFWSANSKHFYFEQWARGNKWVHFMEGDPTTGKTHAVIDQMSDGTYVDPNLTWWRLIHNGDQILWSSDRDGWNHLYLYNGRTGQLEDQVTHGNWPVRRIVRVDAKDGEIYFMGSGQKPGEDPYQEHLYKVKFDGSGLTMLDPEDADHAVWISPDNTYFVDNYSRPDLPPVSVLRSTSDGHVVATLEKSNIAGLLKTGWKFPIRFQGLAADGKTKLYGLIWRPSNFDPNHKYPVIEQIYTGPHRCFTPKTFAAYHDMAQSTAELGFVVVMLDGRGTSCRSRAFHEYSYKNLGGQEPDHIAMIKQMAAKYHWMDLSRVGIYGASTGGYETTHALLVNPQFYKVGVCISGVEDHRLDKTGWNELYQGYPVGPQYAAQSNITLADHLKGHLLLIHGDVDDNVNPVNMMRMVNALIQDNKDFQMLLVPNMFHAEGLHVYVTKRRWNYFVRYLLGVTPPHNYVIPNAPADWVMPAPWEWGGGHPK